MSASRTMVSSGSEFESAVGYSRAVRIGPLVVVAGTTGSGDDIAAQTRDALRTDISRWREVGEVHAQAFGKIRPVTSMVEVTALIAPGLLVEIEADAYVGSAVADRNSGAGPKDPSPAGG